MRGPALVHLTAMLLTAAAVGLDVADGEGTDHGPEDVVRHGLSRALRGMFAPCAYEGTRRLEAETRDRSGWIEVATRYSPQLGFSYRVTAEGGHRSVRRRALLKVLETEAAASRNNRHEAPSVVDYDMGAPTLGDEDNVLRVSLTPRRRAPTLLSGWFVLEPDGVPRLLEGTLSRSPSFWVKSVQARWTFGRVGENVLPVRVDSIADVRFVGPSRFTMTYAYNTAGTGLEDGSSAAGTERAPGGRVASRRSPVAHR